MKRSIRVTRLPDGSEIFEGAPEDVARALELRRGTPRQAGAPLDGASALIELAKSGEEFHLAKAIFVLTGDLVPTRINGQPNPRYDQALRMVEGVLSTYARTNNSEFVVRKEGRHKLLQLVPKAVLD